MGINSGRTFTRVFIHTKLYTDKKENKTFLIYKEIQMGSGLKSYLRKGFLVQEAVCHI
jgi:hypothetical protein